jgi:hypothetical protein
MRRKILVICHAYELERPPISILSSFDRHFDLSRYTIEEGWPRDIRQFPEYDSLEAVIWFVRFRELQRSDGFDWADFRGARIMYDLDVNQNYYSITTDERFRGAWPAVFHRFQFHVLACSGKETTLRLADEGVTAAWIPKAYDPEIFFDLGRERSAVCHYGTIYPPRAAMLKFLERRRVDITLVRANYLLLNERLNDFLSCVVCNMECEYRFPFNLRALRRLRASIPAEAVDVWPGPEAMNKNFEVAGSGCALICDATADLPDLGFEDGVNAVTYRTFEELTDKIRMYARAPEELATIAGRGAQLCRTRHTWDLRMPLIEDLVQAHGSR